MTWRGHEPQGRRIMSGAEGGICRDGRTSRTYINRKYKKYCLPIHEGVLDGNRSLPNVSPNAFFTRLDFVCWRIGAPVVQEQSLETWRS